MPLMEIVLTQEFAGQLMLNRWNYVASGTPASVTYSFALVQAFGAIPNVGVYPPDTMIDNIHDIQTQAVTFQSIEAKDVYSTIDFYATGFTPLLTGISAAQALSPAMAVGYVSSRVRTDIRRGTKRFSGIPESSNGDSGAIDPAVLVGPVAVLASRMSQVLTYDDEGNTLTFTPAIVKKQRYAVPDSDPVRYAYRYIPGDEGGATAQLAQTASGVLWTPYSNLRTQTSRQYGRGR